jgi:hypothetical protein
MSIPDVIFIIPYRDREKEKNIFIEKMTIILQKSTISYKFLFIHQTDNRDFNRGAMKNIGFIVVKDMYPETYQYITLCFNDIDTYPNDDTLLLHYKTIPGIVKHFYGYLFALHGIVSITGKDFENINGYPNYWSWGFEDNMLYDRVKSNLIAIDRSTFFAIGDTRIIQTNDHFNRVVNRGEFDRYVRKINEGISSITNIQYIINDDNMVHVIQFDTEYSCKQHLNENFDIRSPNPPFSVGYSAKRRATMNMIIL